MTQGAMDRPLLSIVIPSCNRHEYLKSILGTLLRETGAELVVSDNSDTPLDAPVLQELNACGRIVYRHHVEKLSVVDNFERALKLSTGQYIIFIGDDDCVGPGVEDIVSWARDNKVEAVISYGDRFIANYFWPEVTSRYFGSGYAGKLFLARHTGAVRRLDARQAILSAASRPGTGLGVMARAYHGIVSRELVDRVVSRYGQLFGGVSPDIYSATLLTYAAERACIIDYPFVIPGASPRSTAGEGAARQDTDKLKGRDHITRFGDNLQWDARIPEFYSPVTVWSYSHQKALDKLLDSDYGLDFPRLYVKCLLQYWGHREAVFSAVHHWRQSGSLVGLLGGFLRGALAELVAQGNRVWYRFVTPPVAVSGVQTIGDAYGHLKIRLSVWTPPVHDVFDGSQ
jgi:hypothetical protein